MAIKSKHVAAKWKREYTDCRTVHLCYQSFNKENERTDSVCRRFVFLFSCPRISFPKIIHGIPRMDGQKVTTVYRQALSLLSVTRYKPVLYVGTVQYVTSLLFASFCYFLITRLTFYITSFMSVMYFCFLFCCILRFLVVSPFVPPLSYFCTSLTTTDTGW
jgi:hypothetical protein